MMACGLARCRKLSPRATSLAISTHRRSGMSRLLRSACSSEPPARLTPHVHRTSHHCITVNFAAMPLDTQQLCLNVIGCFDIQLSCGIPSMGSCKFYEIRRGVGGVHVPSISSDTIMRGSSRVQAPRNCTMLGWCTFSRLLISQASCSRLIAADSFSTCTCMRGIFNLGGQPTMGIAVPKHSTTAAAGCITKAVITAAHSFFASCWSPRSSE